MDVCREWSSDAQGLSLVGLLMVVVVLGALTATAIVGVSTLTGSSASSGRGSTTAEAAAAGAAGAAPGAVGSGSLQSACRASADAARSATTFYFANNGRSYPVSWSDMTTSNPPIYKLATNVVINSDNSKELDGRGWKLIMSGGGATQPTFTCS